MCACVRVRESAHVHVCTCVCVCGGGAHVFLTLGCFALLGLLAVSLFLCSMASFLKCPKWSGLD